MTFQSLAKPQTSKCLVRTCNRDRYKFHKEDNQKGTLTPLLGPELFLYERPPSLARPLGVSESSLSSRTLIWLPSNICTPLCAHYHAHACSQMQSGYTTTARQLQLTTQEQRIVATAGSTTIASATTHQAVATNMSTPRMSPYVTAGCEAT